MNNWEEVHECQDEREAEHICKQAQLMKTSSMSTNELFSDSQNNFDIDKDIDFVETLTGNRLGKDMAWEHESFALKHNLIL